MIQWVRWIVVCAFCIPGVARWSSAATTVANGTVTSEWPAVGALIVRLSGGYSECTATLISPTWVLTAAHCLQDSSNPQDYVFVPQPDYSCCVATDGLAVSAIVANPAYNFMAHDQGLVQLASPLTGVTPFMVNNQAAPAVGNYLHLLGYGLTDGGGNTLKQRGLMKITGSDSTTISYDGVQPYSQACPGDSGGPSFNYAPNGFPVVDATVSYSLSAQCSTSNSSVVSSRTDSDINWILSHATDACLRSAPGGCDGIFRNGGESLTIAPAAPIVTRQPANVSIPAQWFAFFHAAASGDPPPTVQWQASPNGINYVDAPGYTSPVFETYADPLNNGIYVRAVFTNALGSATTDGAQLTVLAAQDYNPANCAAVVNTLDIAWVAVGGTAKGCSGVEHTDGSLADAADGSFTMNGVSVSNTQCLTPAAYAFTLSQDKQTLSGADTAYNVPMTLTLSSDGACFVGHWISGDDDYIATIWNFAGP